MTTISDNMTINEAVKQLCGAPSCLSKSMAREILKKYGEEKWQEGVDYVEEMPMGASKWMAHGIKYGYLEYFNFIFDK
jgi:5,10-methenyltetrahydromethanopterin hydrogenase